MSIKQIGQYEILAQVGEGGMGKVYKARHVDHGTIVAIKLVSKETAKQQLLIKRFEKEFKAASSIDHPNVVKALEYSVSDSQPYIVMEFVDGESLGAKVEREGPLPELEAVRLLGQICEALHRAHKQGLIHRDVKPDNIMITKEGDAKLTDLGLVKDVDDTNNLTRTGRGLGTPHYMSPEQFRNAKNADIRCDIYSLGATLYTMVTGVVPFAKSNPLECWMKKSKNEYDEPRKLIPALSDRVNRAIQKAMHADPAARPASCRQLMEELIGRGWTPGEGLSNAASDVIQVPPQDLWYMVYYDENGKARTVKGTTQSIRRNLAAGALGDVSVIVVSRVKQGPFLPINSQEEFADLVRIPKGTGVRPRNPSSGVRAPSTARQQPTGRPGSAVTSAPARRPVSGQSGARITPIPMRPQSNPVHEGSTEAYPIPAGSVLSTPLGHSGFPVQSQVEEKSTSYIPWIVALIAGSVGLILGIVLFWN